MKLTVRQKKALRLIYNAKEHIDIGTIAKELNVSSRTILREIPVIETFIEDFNCYLQKKKGLGIFLSGHKVDLSNLREAILNEKEVKIYTKEEREIILISELLEFKEPVKISYFSRNLNVGESTIISDLDRIESWLEKNKLKLIRRAGIGVYLEGNEKSIRKAIMKLIYDNMAYEKMINLITNNDARDDRIVENRDDRIIDNNIIKDIKDVLDGIKKDSNIVIQENYYISLLIHILIIIKRTKNKEVISEEKFELDIVKNSEEFNLATIIIQAVEKKFNIKVNDKDIQYISLRLIGMKRYENEDLVEKERVVNLAREFIKITENEKGIFINDSEEIFKELIVHLSIAIKRIKYEIEIRNPLLKEIQCDYKELYSVAKKCAKVLEMDIKKSIPEDEVGYIAIHLGALIERNTEKYTEKYRAVIVCPAGIGASILIGNKMRKNFPQIEIVDKISAIDFNEEKLKEKRIDIIIATVNLDVKDIKVVRVKSLLSENDRKKILKEIDTINKKDISKENQFDKEFIEKIERVNKYTQGIKELLEDAFTIDSGAESIIEAMEAISVRIGDNSDNQRRILRDLKLRESKGSTVLEDEKIMVLHCRTSGVERLKVGVYNFKKDISLKSEYTNTEVRGALVMLAPENMMKEHSEIMGQITTTIIEEEFLIERMIESNNLEFKEILSKIMKNFYEKVR